MAENNTQATATPEQTTNATEKKPVSEKTQAHRDALKAMRQVKVDYRAPGATIATVQATSPKKAGSKARKVWDLYQPGMTVADLLTKAGELGEWGKSYAQACIQWDVRHGFIALTVVAPAKAEQPAA